MLCSVCVCVCLSAGSLEAPLPLLMAQSRLRTSRIIIIIIILTIPTTIQLSGVLSQLQLDVSRKPNKLSMILNNRMSFEGKVV